MTAIDLKLDGILYKAIRLPSGVYSITLNNMKLLQITVKVDRHLNCTWSSYTGESTHFINRLGSMIEVHNLKF